MSLEFIANKEQRLHAMQHMFLRPITSVENASFAERQRAAQFFFTDIEQANDWFQMR
jgi:hypothetical protein